MIPVALTIAGSDPSGGAGIQADLKTFHQHQVYGASVLTLLTVQNTQSVDEVRILDPNFIDHQLRAVLEDIPPHAAKTGALGSTEVIEAIARQASRFEFPLVVDPVMISKHGYRLLDESAVEILVQRLFPHAFLITPNLHEAASLTGRTIRDRASLRDAVLQLSSLGPRHVLVKGGHHFEDSVDLLYCDGELIEFPAVRVDTQHTHGSGCSYSAAITAQLALGRDLVTAIRGAKRFITEAIRTNHGLGKGIGPLNLFANVS